VFPEFPVLLMLPDEQYMVSVLGSEIIVLVSKTLASRFPLALSNTY
jgi:hypothetical protein